MALTIFLKCGHRCSLDDIHSLSLVVPLVEGGQFRCEQTRHCVHSIIHNLATRPNHLMHYKMGNV